MPTPPSRPSSRPSTRPADPLAETDLLLVDGTNLLHRMSSSRTAAPRSALIARLRGAVPERVAIEVVFDGPPTPGLRDDRIASGMRVRFSGGRTADAVLVAKVDDRRRAEGPLGTAATLVVTDDRALRHALHRLGARTAGAAWLLGRLERVGAPARGAGAPRRAPATGRTAPPDPSTDDGEDDAPRWEPGRRATVKKGNARRAPRGAKRDGPHRDGRC